MGLNLLPKRRPNRRHNKRTIQTPERPIRNRVAAELKFIKNRMKRYNSMLTGDKEKPQEMNALFRQLFKTRTSAKESERRVIDAYIAELAQPIVRKRANSYWNYVTRNLGKKVPGYLSADDLIGEGNLQLVTRIIPAFDLNRKGAAAFPTFLLSSLNNLFRSVIFSRDHRDTTSYHSFENPQGFVDTHLSTMPRMPAIPDEAAMDLMSISDFDRAIGLIKEPRRRRVMEMIFENPLKPVPAREVARKLKVSPQSVDQLRKNASKELVGKYPQFRAYFREYDKVKRNIGADQKSK